jgi:hypothetical protein
MTTNDDYTILPDAHLTERIEELNLLISENSMYLDYLKRRRQAVVNEIQRRKLEQKQ